MLNIGSSEADITPDLPIDLSGFALRVNPSSKVLDPLKIRWLAFRDSLGTGALIGAADVLSYSRSTFQAMENRIHAAIKSPLGIGLATSHTHSGPATVRLRHCGKMKKSYLASMKDRVVSSACAAVNSLGAGAVTVKVGTTAFDGNLNRRRGEEGAVDREVLTLQFEDASTGTPMGIIVNYACHPVSLGHENTGVSADFPGYLCSAVEKETGAPCLFLNGACGDINPRIAHEVRPAVAQTMGNQLATVAVRSLNSGTVVPVESLQWHRQTVKLPVQVPSSIAAVEKRLDSLEQNFGLDRKLFSDRIARDSKLLANGSYPRSVTITISLLMLGNELGIMFVPGEVFASIGLCAKEMALPGRLLVSGFSNGSVGYLSDKQAFAEGGYEPCFANFFYDYPEFEPSLEDAVLSGMQKLIVRGGLNV